MIKFDSTQFGSVTIDGKKYSDVIVAEDEVVARKKHVLKKMYGTSHKISKNEVDKLTADNPEYIVIGTGQEGGMEIDKNTRKKIEEKAMLIILHTPEAIAKYNELVESHKVNALIHTTN
ncbi:hypothetical protein JXI42_04240 [bacterium]|nr:hypothetical protein [bacterium]